VGLGGKKKVRERGGIRRSLPCRVGKLHQQEGNLERRDGGEDRKSYMPDQRKKSKGKRERKCTFLLPIQTSPKNSVLTYGGRTSGKEIEGKLSISRSLSENTKYSTPVEDSRPRVCRERAVSKAWDEGEEERTQKREENKKRRVDIEELMAARLIREGWRVRDGQSRTGGKREERGGRRSKQKRERAREEWTW